MFFDKQSITVLTGTYRECLENISNHLTSISDPNYKQLKDQFNDAINCYNHAEIENMTKNAICRLLGEDDLKKGLKKYCDKFQLKLEDFEEKSEMDIIYFIFQHKNKIDQTLKEHNL